jgi:predicted O-methyltransferase YrrM
MTFTADWFTMKTPAWRDHVIPHFQRKDGSPVHCLPRWLEVGSYEGKSALWTLENVLAGKGSVTCIDFFDDDLSYISLWATAGYEKRFDENTAKEREEGTIVKLKGDTRNLLPDLIRQESRFHGAYIDGAHEEEMVWHDLTLTWSMLYPGAILVCDDYGFKDRPGAKMAIDRFLNVPRISAKVLFTDFQIIMQKTG